ncbi:hypothetical protein FYZ48_10240 [Gimesia chilikensis]|uniref:hypothetical protein n=1 Tax=Gimesia chilikensis TaxID=2605989 RepID=UPI0011EC42ED|nr:hypothetical protein [Gimesia chilikensis]KAA0139030.1 hypothetical protein FYZ48_10240 [Gimesia chilikensis]
MMESAEPVLRQPVTAEYVLSVFQDQHRQIFLLEHDMLPREELTFETPVEEWQWQCDYLEWRPLGRAWNESWGIDLTDEEWREVLTPKRKKTLGGVCELIARHASAPVIREETFFGKPCRPASAFLTIRALLKEAGADVSEIAPSSSLFPYTNQFAGTFRWNIANLALGALPGAEVINWDLYRGADLSLLWMTGTLPFALMFSLGSHSLWLMLVPGFFLLLFLLFRWQLHHLGGRRLQFGKLQTFRDLAELIATEAPVVVTT